MNVREQIEELRRQKTPHSAEEMSRMAWERYAQLKDQFEPSQLDEYVMIEVDSGDYFLGKTSNEALRNAQEAYPKKAFFLIRIGHRAAGKKR